jgi:hypothetical protein
MTSFVDAVEELRGAVAGSAAAADTSLRQALEDAGFGEAEALDRPDGVLSHVWLEPPESVPLAALEECFGPAHRLPTRPDAWSSPRVVQFNDTIPREGEVGATVLAEVDDADRVVRVTLRRDEF